MSPTVLNLIWTSPPEAEWNGDRRGFRIVLVEVETNTTQQFTVADVTATSYRMSSLHPFYNYECRIVAYNSAGRGPFSSTVTARLPEDGIV